MHNFGHSSIARSVVPHFQCADPTSSLAGMPCCLASYCSTCGCSQPRWTYKLLASPTRHACITWAANSTLVTYHHLRLWPLCLYGTSVYTSTPSCCCCFCCCCYSHIVLTATCTSRFDPALVVIRNMLPEQFAPIPKQLEPFKGIS